MDRWSRLVMGESVVLLGLVLFWVVRTGAAGSAGETGLDAPQRAAAAEAEPAPSGLVPPRLEDATSEGTADAAGRREAAVTVVVHGELLGPNGQAGPKEASVSFRRPGECRVGTVAAGEYAAAGLSPGTWRARVWANGWATYDRDHELGESALQRLDLAMERAPRVAVFLRTPEGESLVTACGRYAQGLAVIVTEEPLGGDLPMTSQQSVGDVGLGRFRRIGAIRDEELPAGADGELQLDHPPPVHATLLLRHLVLAQQPITVGQERLTLTVDPAVVRAKLSRVSLRLVDGALGKPISRDAWVRVSTLDTVGDECRPDDAGRVLVEGLLPGALRLEAEAPGRERIRRMLRVRAGETLQLGDLVLHACVMVRGRLVDEQGKPLAGHLSWADADRVSPLDAMLNSSWAASPDGEFTVGLGPRRWMLLATAADGRQGATLVDTRHGEPRPLEIRLQPAVRVVMTSGRRPQDVFVVALKDAEGRIVVSRQLDPRWTEQVLHAAAGDYLLEVFDADGRRLAKKPIRARSATVYVTVP